MVVSEEWRAVEGQGGPQSAREGHGGSERVVEGEIRYKTVCMRTSKGRRF